MICFSLVLELFYFLLTPYQLITTFYYQLAILLKVTVIFFSQLLLHCIRDTLCVIFPPSPSDSAIDVTAPTPEPMKRRGGAIRLKPKVAPRKLIKQDRCKLAATVKISELPFHVCDLRKDGDEKFKSNFMVNKINILKFWFNKHSRMLHRDIYIRQ